MSTPAPAPKKLCHVCHKDVANAKRVKDPAGHYFCQACYDAANAASAGVPRGAATAAKVPHVSGARPVSVNVTTPPPSQNDDYNFDEPPPSPRVAPPAPASSKLPEFCPHCGMKVVHGRKLCIKCKRDITAPAKNFDAGGKGAEVVASMVGRLIKLAVWVVVIGFIVFAGYGVKLLLFTKIVPFEEYPTTRVAAVKQFLGFVEKGGDKNYDQALNLISFRIRHGSNNENEDTFWKVAFGRMHDEFTKRYGEGWLSKATIKGPAGSIAMDSSCQVIFDKEAWDVGVQVQITVDKARMDMLARKEDNYPENGQWRFGISEMEQFPVHPNEIVKEVGKPHRPFDQENDQ